MQKLAVSIKKREKAKMLPSQRDAQRCCTQTE